MQRAYNINNCAPIVIYADITKFSKPKRINTENVKTTFNPFGWYALPDEEQNLELE